MQSSLSCGMFWVFLGHSHPCTGFQGEMDAHKRHVYLTRFYKTTVGNLLPVSSESSDQDECKCLILRFVATPGARSCSFYRAGNGYLESLSLKEVIPHKITETYTCAKVSSVESHLCWITYACMLYYCGTDFLAALQGICNAQK